MVTEEAVALTEELRGLKGHILTGLQAAEDQEAWRMDVQIRLTCWKNQFEAPCLVMVGEACKRLVEEGMIETRRETDEEFHARLDLNGGRLEGDVLVGGRFRFSRLTGKARTAHAA
jgi:hypothetical protein